VVAAVVLPMPVVALVIVATDVSTVLLDELVFFEDCVFMVLLLEAVLVLRGGIVHVVSGTTVPGGMNPLGMVA